MLASCLFLGMSWCQESFGDYSPEGIVAEVSNIGIGEWRKRAHGQNCLRLSISFYFFPSINTEMYPPAAESTQVCHHDAVGLCHLWTQLRRGDLEQLWALAAHGSTHRPTSKWPHFWEVKGIAEAAKQPLVALVALVGFNHWAVEAKNDMLANIARFGMGFANVFSLPLMFSSLTEVIQKWYRSDTEVIYYTWKGQLQ